MTSGTLSLIQGNASFDIEGTLPLLIDGAARLDRTRVFCRNLRRRGICSLFLEGVPQYLMADLQRSGAAFLYGLASASEEEKATGDAGPFFDAVASGDFDVARGIARLSRDTWNSQREYEDDFLYAFLLMKKFFLGGLDENVRPLLARFELLAKPGGDPRADVCAALVEGDPVRFERSFGGLIRNYESYYRDAVSRDEVLEEEWGTEGQFFTEGLALVRLAAVSGFVLEDEYQFVPSVVIGSRSEGLGMNSWRNP